MSGRLCYLLNHHKPHGVTVKVWALLVPAGATTLTAWPPSPAVAVTVQFAVTVVAVGVPVMVQVTPAPATVIWVAPVM